MCGSRSHRQAFTLIELLVVISISAILISLLMPVTARCLAKARQTACAVQLKQMGTAVASYVPDFQQRLPYVHSVLWNSDASENWSADPDSHPKEFLQVMKPYVNNLKRLRCPTAVRGYPQSDPKMTYRIASANNSGTEQSMLNAKGEPTYYYSLQYLNGRRYEIKNVDGGSLPWKLVNGPGPYYLIRDFVIKTGEDSYLQAHGAASNQLYLDLHVSLYKESAHAFYGLTAP